MDKIKLVQLVRKEAENIKKNATKEEISFLDFEMLQSSQSNSCIYGQMTGSCWSKRTAKLIEECTERMYIQNPGESSLNKCTLSSKLISKIKFTIHRDYYSPIECFIYFSENETNGNNEALINYLKGNTKELVLKEF